MIDYKNEVLNGKWKGSGDFYLLTSYSGSREMTWGLFKSMEDAKDYMETRPFADKYDFKYITPEWSHNLEADFPGRVIYRAGTAHGAPVLVFIHRVSLLEQKDPDADLIAGLDLEPWDEKEGFSC